MRSSQHSGHGKADDEGQEVADNSCVIADIAGTGLGSPTQSSVRGVKSASEGVSP